MTKESLVHKPQYQHTKISTKPFKIVIEILGHNLLLAQILTHKRDVNINMCNATNV